jgi:glycosyltransferase involved in cell wall biosynthesis
VALLDDQIQLNSRLTRPEVTVIIPTRNRRDFLRQSVTDTLRQQEVDLEVVIVDDGSTDGDALHDVEGLDERIRMVRHPSRHGVANARNTGIDSARGEWLAFLDDDDRWSPLKLRTQLDAASASGASWAYCGAVTVDVANRVVSASSPPDEAPIMRSVLERNPVPGGCSNAIARTNIVRAVGGFDESLGLLADWDLWIRLAEAGPPAVCCGFLVGYRVHRDNMHVRDVDAIAGELAHIADKYSTRLVGVHPDLSVWHGDAYRRAGKRGAAARIYFKRLQLTRDPVDLRRITTTLLGERVTDTLRRCRPAPSRPAPPRPPWLDAVPSIEN